MNDSVNHPSHYTAGGIECIDAITAALTCHTEPIGAWLTGQVIKYLWRWPMKNGQAVVEDSKGFRTDEYKIKRKLMLWVHGIRIKET